MGCSPSKGNLFSKPESHGPQSPVLAESTQVSVDSTHVKDLGKCLETNEEENEVPAPTEEYPAEYPIRPELASETQITEAQRLQETEETVKTETHPIVSEVVQTQTVESKEKRKKNRGKRKSIETQRKSSIIKTKVDFPPQMVRAHQAAYGFLNPNISKYEALMGLLDQAAQTQLSIQPMMSALVMRFEEINQALEEIAEEGELMLKEHGDYMALPSGIKGPAVMSVKPSGDTLGSNDPPPDLLQLMLQQSTEKMRQVGGSAQTLGDATLEEAVEYFSSLSKLLFEKLQAKQAAERRLTHVLARVEGAAVKKANPEDVALHSEDSGIGGENESLTGSERHQHHRGSAGSGSTGSGAKIHGAHDSVPNNSLNLIGGDEDDEDEDDNEYDGEFEDDHDDRPGRKRSNSSPPDPSQPHVYMQGRHPTVQRPLTAINAKRENSSPIIVMDLQTSQRDLDQRLTKKDQRSKMIQENKDVSAPHLYRHRAGLRRHSLCGSAGAQKAQSSCSLPALAPQPPKQPSVRRLINAFSQGVDGRPGQSLANLPPHIKRSMKSEILVLSDTGGLVINGNNNNNSWPDSRYDSDSESLPPPPPEVLMDNSFQSTDGMPGNSDGLQEHSGRTLPMIPHRTGAAHRLKTSFQNVEVLPNRASVRPSIPPSHPLRQGAVAGSELEEQQTENDLDPEMETALYQQARKIICLRNAAECSAKRNIGPRPLQAKMGPRCESIDFNEGEQISCLPVTAPPVSRVRLPPSCPTVCHRFPSPPVFRPQSTSRPSSRPSSPRTVIRASDHSTEEIVPLVSFRDARSVFCQNEFMKSQTSISPVSCELSRPWGEACRGRIPTKARDSPTRRTRSEQRPGLSSRGPASSQARGHEPRATKYRSTSPLRRSDDPQLEASATESAA
ncbi:photoreceptor cilium actin regulator [Betta splendens]|uniref:Photoreceptor cilium actin regulator n=1 Tax=Betta splendens TaxID=158456 RepID=A0A6P7LVT6_BETSP|nr:photoreceptor cilium actin regulator [Betta splendens]